MNSNDRFNNADGGVVAVVTAPIVDKLVPPPAIPAIEPIIIDVAAKGSITDRANKLAAAKAKNQEAISRISKWSTHNANYVAKLNASIDKLSKEVAAREADVAALGGMDVKSPNRKNRHRSVHLANLKSFLSKRKSQLAQANKNHEEIIKRLDHANEKNEKLTSMASADGSEYSNMDGISMPKVDMASMIIGLALGASLAILAVKYKSKLGF